MKKTIVTFVIGLILAFTVTGISAHEGDMKQDTMMNKQTMMKKHHRHHRKMMRKHRRHHKMMMKKNM